MNTPDDDKRQAAEREWALQERALDAERAGAPAGGDARAQRYRAVARALREPIVPQLPADFAKQVAQRARWREGVQFDGRFERLLGIALFAAFAVAALYHIGPIIAALAASPGGRVLTNEWVLAMLACLAVSGGMQWWLRRRLR